MAQDGGQRLQCLHKSKKVQDGQGVLHRPTGGCNGEAPVRRGQKQDADTVKGDGGSGYSGNTAHCLLKRSKQQ